MREIDYSRRSAVGLEDTLLDEDILPKKLNTRKAA